MNGKVSTVARRRALVKPLLSAGIAVALLLSLSANGTSWATPDQSRMRGIMPPFAQGSSAHLDKAPSGGAAPLTFIFQKWVSPDPFYSGVADTYIALYNPNANYGGLGTMRLHSGAGGRERLLVKFDISRIPTSATVVQASLNLFAWYRDRAYRVTAYAYKVKAHWDEGDATWNRATAESFWAAVGCQDPILDYDPESVAATELNYTNQWYSWDLTEMVQQWVASPVSNEGVLIVADGLNVQYQFRTSEIPAANLRPSLTVTYYLGEPPTTPTGTATQTLTPTVSPTGSRTPQESPTPTRSPTATWPPGVTPTATVPLEPVDQLFQQGIYPLETYAGVSDTFLSAYRPTTPWGSDDGFRVSGRGNGTERALIRFDLQGHIPTNAHVLSAKLSAFAWSRRTLYGMRVSAYDVMRPWDVAAATWNLASPGGMWGIPGCDQVGADRQGDPVASKFVYFTNQFYDWDVTPLVQRWVNDPPTNMGLLLIGHDVDQELRFRSSEWRVPQQRPKLSVVYTAP